MTLRMIMNLRGFNSALFDRMQNDLLTKFVVRIENPHFRSKTVLFRRHPLCR